MSEPTEPLAIDPGLLERYRAAGTTIAWRAAAVGTMSAAGQRVRVAHLHDEEVRVLESGRGRRVRVTVDPGPLGALVILLEVDRRGPPTGLGGQETGRDPNFPSGAIVAAWGGGPVPHDSQPSLNDLVELARYALA